MTRPLLEVADIVRAQGDRFIHSNFRWIHWAHRKVLRAIARCRTAALGGHRDQCPRCGYRTTSYKGAEFYEAQHRKQQLIHLKRKAAQLGLQIIEVAAAA